MDIRTTYSLSALILVFGTGGVSAQDSAKSKKEDLRYDGKDFNYWREYWQTELKPERRLEAVRAMGMFGMNGYANEAARSIIGVLKACAEEDLAYPLTAYSDGGKDLTPEQRLSAGALEALRKVGAAAVERAILEDWKEPGTRRIVIWMVDMIRFQVIHGKMDFLEKDFNSVIVKMLLDSDPDLRNSAIDMLHRLGEELKQIFGNELTKPDVRKVIFEAALSELDGRDELAKGWPSWRNGHPGSILLYLGPVAKPLVPELLKRLNGLRERCEQEIAAYDREFKKFQEARSAEQPAQQPRNALPACDQSCELVEILAAIGPDAKEALPTLEALSKNPWEELREAARSAIRVIRGEKGAESGKKARPVLP
ncbi:MAG: hypothetical protein HY040_00450 [Planctomycetes bacterium]|nr:hypothetical protein [Planctomycetota bacterium]